MLTPLALHVALALPMLAGCGDKEGSSLILDDDGDGYTAEEGDCNDDDASIRPGAVEVCDGVDQDCNGIIDDDPTDGEIFHLDEDGDGWGDPVATVQECAQPDGYVLDSTDCDDKDGSVYPGAAETCNEIDDDCDKAVDEDATDAEYWYRDADGDSYGDATDAVWECDKPDGYVADDTDCDDDLDDIHPDADEYCNGVDEDCDHEIDEDALDGTPFYTDADNDDYGDDATEVILCEGGGSLVEVAGDCDDGDGTVYPAAPELCGDGQVNACEGTPDEAADECGGWGDPVLDADASASTSGVDSLGAGLGRVGDNLVIGAPFAGDAGQGQVYLVSLPVLGSDLLSGATTITGTSDSEGLGAEVAGIADVDGDGTDDLLLAGTAEGDLAQGIVYLLPGDERSYDVSSDALATWTGEATGDLAGPEALVGAGDLTDDGSDDFVVGARYGSLGGDLAGQAYVVSSDSTGSHDLGDADARLYATSAYGFAMARLLAPGDLDGDGLDDLVLEGTGDLAWVVFGPVAGDVDVQADFDLAVGGKVTGDLSDLAARDVDGDGVLDLALSVAADSTEATYGGAAWLHTGGWSGTEVDLSAATLAIYGTAETGFMGGELALVDDLDGDGQPDLVLGTGASTVEDDSLSALGGTGQALVFSGVHDRSGSLTDTSADLSFIGDDEDFGMDLADLGDLDGDGRSDLVIAAPETGAAWLFLADRRY